VGKFSGFLVGMSEQVVVGRLCSSGISVLVGFECSSTMPADGSGFAGVSARIVVNV
jgi:hypothetical protein